MARDNFKASVKTALRERVAHRCSNPSCRVATAAPGAGIKGVILGGDAAHIAAASPGGPRYDGSLSGEQRASIENGIWLCLVCARKVDRDPVAYPASLLREWKERAETTAGHELGMRTDSSGDGTELREIREELSAIQAALRQQVAAEPLDHLMRALRHFLASSEVQGRSITKLSQQGRYAEAATEAIHLADSEARAAALIGEAAADAHKRAAARWLDAGDVSFVSDKQRAAEAYQKCTVLDPTNPYGWSRLGEASWWLGKLDQALYAYTKLWYLMPDGVGLLAKAIDPETVQAERFAVDQPTVSRDAYLWVVRGVLVAGLNIVEILRREPSLVSEWVVTLVPVDRPGGPVRPTDADAESIADFFCKRAYNLGGAIEKYAGQIEHRGLLERLAFIAQGSDALELSEQYLQRARTLSVEQSDFVAEAIYLSNLGVLAGKRGDLNTARKLFESVLATCSGDPNQGKIFISRHLVPVEEAKRRRLLHEKKLAEGTAIAKPLEDEIEVCNLLWKEFEVDAEAAGRRAIKLKELEGKVHGNLANIAESEGDRRLSREEYLKALSAFKSIGFKAGIDSVRRALRRKRWKLSRDASKAVSVT